MSDDPFDDPLWKEAARRADGYARPRVGYVGFPEAWLERVLPIVSNSAQQLTVALIMYRRLRYDKPVSVPNGEFAALGISRQVKYRTLTALEQAGLIAIERTVGRAMNVWLSWEGTCYPVSTRVGGSK
jgi:hypothetical protein